MPELPHAAERLVMRADPELIGVLQSWQARIVDTATGQLFAEFGARCYWVNRKNPRGQWESKPEWKFYRRCFA